ncbi:MAG TPA: cation:proton antiporter [Bryobacteraceae bacterium]|nr:cation:proton antiporter [Bryobacteraceae bacterium]
MTLVLLLLQIAVILAVCRLLHELCERIGQPPVIGEIIAGLLLGPSLFGWLAPNLFARLFPPASLPALNALSQIGLVLFMFLVGLHLDVAEVWALRGVAGLAGLLSIAVPFAAGFALAKPLHFLAPASPTLPFSLFCAVAMSITAFPVLARILADQKLTATRLGHVAIACAAFNDVLAWALLAWIVAVSRSAESSLVEPIAIVVIYSAVMWFIVRPLLRFVPSELATMLIFVFLSSWVTELAGLHALFGAFFAGVIWPRGSLKFEEVSAKIEPIAMAVLIPLFFSYTGLRTNIGVVNWSYTLVIIGVAVFGKVGGAFAGARIMGFDSRNALSLGVLLNTRGLVELVVLNVGLDLGILTPELFSMMVVMALVTTLMTSPALNALKVAKNHAVRSLNRP